MTEAQKSETTSTELLEPKNNERTAFKCDPKGLIAFLAKGLHLGENVNITRIRDRKINLQKLVIGDLGTSTVYENKTLDVLRISGMIKSNVYYSNLEVLTSSVFNEFEGSDNICFPFRALQKILGLFSGNVDVDVTGSFGKFHNEIKAFKIPFQLKKYSPQKYLNVEETLSKSEDPIVIEGTGKDFTEIKESLQDIAYFNSSVIYVFHPDSDVVDIDLTDKVMGSYERVLHSSAKINSKTPVKLIFDPDVLSSLLTTIGTTGILQITESGSLYIKMLSYTQVGEKEDYQLYELLHASIKQ